MSAPVAATAAPATAPATSPPSVGIRQARYRDVPSLVRLYLHRSRGSRHGYHPFAFNRPTITVAYLALVTAQSGFAWAMRRAPRFLAVLLVAEVDGTHEIAGSGTLRGVVRRGEEPKVRFGFVVGEPYQGRGIGKQLLWALAERGRRLGFRRGVGVVFQSDARALAAIEHAGFRFSPTTYRDPRAPEETNYSAEADLDEMVARSRGRGPPGSAATEPELAS